MAVILMIFLLALPASGAARGVQEKHVMAGPEYFFPSSVSIDFGGTVSWDFDGTDRTHSAKDGSGMELFDSGPVGPDGPSYVFTFAGAGSYPVICVQHENMNGRVNVTLRAGPTQGSVKGAFKVTWASQPAPEGFAYDVQVRAPGSSWRMWLDDVARPDAQYRPGKDGIYRFRARMLRPELAASADWSPADAARVRS
ncbi:MAG: hypothetical protein WEA10_04075 [Actinomycetota bacterium]